MKKYLKFFTAFLLIVLSDGMLTAVNTPDLEMEGNPLILNFGLGWPALVTVNLILLIVYYCCAKMAFCDYNTVVASESMTFKEYIAFLFYGDKTKFIWSFVKPIKMWRPFLAMFSYSFCYTLFFTRLIVVVEWIFISLDLYWQPYWDLRWKAPLHRLDAWVGVALAIIFMFRWMFSEYKKSNIMAESIA